MFYNGIDINIINPDKFNNGDVVRIKGGLSEGEIFTVKEKTDEFFPIKNNNYEEIYHVNSDERPYGLTMRSGNLELIRRNVPYNYNEYMESVINGYDVTNEPMFRVGDVINIGDSETLYSIEECIEVESDFHKEWKYKLSDTNLGYTSYIPGLISESDITFRWHDNDLEKMFNESSDFNLPAWRGEIYNFFMFFDRYQRVSLEPDAAVNYHEMEEFKNHTIPPIRMWHILRSHSIFARVNDVIKSKENSHIIAEKINIDIVDVIRFSKDFQDKIISRNTTNTTYGNELKDLMIPKFTKEEEIFANIIDRLDTSNKGIKDHYPYKLTNLQIMDAIREAYNNARKIGKKKINTSNNSSDENPDASYKGKQLYEGYSGKYNLVIQFIYNFDYDFVETAYPVRMNNNVKKH